MSFRKGLKWGASLRVLIILGEGGKVPLGQGVEGEEVGRVYTWLWPKFWSLLDGLQMGWGMNRYCTHDLGFPSTTKMNLNIFDGFYPASTLHAIWICFSYCLFSGWVKPFLWTATTIRISEKLTDFVSNLGNPNVSIKWLCHTMGIFREEFCKVLPPTQKQHCPHHPQSSRKAERADGIFKISKTFKNSWAPLAKHTPTSPYGHIVHWQIGSPLGITNWKAHVARNFTPSSRLCPLNADLAKYYKGLVHYT